MAIKVDGVSSTEGDHASDYNNNKTPSNHGSDKVDWTETMNSQSP